jgi:hypothetical protein
MTEKTRGGGEAGGTRSGAQPRFHAALHAGISPMLLKCRNPPIVTFSSMTPVDISEW